MELLWIRHGEPERIAPGTGVPADPPLTSRGRDQSERIAAWLAAEPIDVVLSSPQRRAVETATPIARAHGLDVQVTHGLAQSLEQLAAEPSEFRAEVEEFVDGLVSHYVLDEGRLVVSHAGLKEAYHGRASGRVRIR